MPITSKIIIRKANILDKEDIKILIDKFYEESLKDLGMKFTDYTIDKTIDNFINNHIVILAQEGEKIIGIIGGMLSPSIFDENEIIIQEAMWYVEPEYRKGTLGTDLLLLFEEIAKELGINHIVMVCMGNLNFEILNRFYVKNGYKLLENQFIKTIGV
jgi:N-acetylglutamate synthase-like GNAT family acetyltransferase